MLDPRNKNLNKVHTPEYTLNHLQTINIEKTVPIKMQVETRFLVINNLPKTHVRNCKLERCNLSFNCAQVCQKYAENWKKIGESCVKSGNH